MSLVQSGGAAIAAKTGLAVGVVNDDPPLEANMLDISAYLGDEAPLYVEVVLGGEDATPRALTGAHWFGKHPARGMVDMGPVADGFELSLSTARSHREVLPFVLGIYSHLGIGLGTLAASTMRLDARALDAKGA